MQLPISDPSGRLPKPRDQQFAKQVRRRSAFGRPHETRATLFACSKHRSDRASVARAAFWRRINATLAAAAPDTCDLGPTFVVRRLRPAYLLTLSQGPAALILTTLARRRRLAHRLFAKPAAAKVQAFVAASLQSCIATKLRNAIVLRTWTQRWRVGQQR